MTDYEEFLQEQAAYAEAMRHDDPFAIIERRYRTPTQCQEFKRVPADELFPPKCSRAIHGLDTQHRSYYPSYYVDESWWDPEVI